MHNFFDNAGQPVSNITFDSLDKAPLVINIGRQLGSGGRTIGKMLAKELGLDYYDKEILDIAARESGFCTEIFERSDENKGFFQSFFVNVMPVFGHATDFYQSQISDENLFRLQSDAIRKAVAKGRGGVFIGRCADYVLRDYPNCLNIFLSADSDERIALIASRQQISETEARKLMQRGDERRATYYNYYATGRWGEAANYHLCINTSKLGLEKTAQSILQYIKAYYT
jgi:cytidylate kinase